ncbi:glutamate--tRNA ligase, partial [Candidatus Bathyarchaeota archaeon]|nr:glutamate--tRNA ligase [Candidatus Bathyarchaeota archaeon]
LMELFNVKIESIEKNMVIASFLSETYEDARKAKASLIHWVPVGSEVPCIVVMPDASVKEGLAEGACRNLKPDDIVQFERFGFVRIDDVGVNLTAFFAHK